VRDYELEREPARTRQVSRSVVDDISTWWNGEPNFKVVQEKPEKPFTKQDLDQTLSLVFMPVNLSHTDIFGKQPDPDTCKAAAARLGPAASALQVIAGTKHEAKNQQNILLPLADIQSAQVSLQVMGDYDSAPKLWQQAFQGAGSALEAVLGLPVIDPDAQDPDNADPPPADGVMKRDRDLLEASVKPTLQRLIETTSHVPFATWDPRSYTEGSEALAALSSISHPKLKPVAEAVKRGVDAITTYSTGLEAQAAETAGKLEAAMQKLSQQQAPYVDEVAGEQEQPR
jgi:hypothetical protein